MKRILPLLAATAVALSLSACSSSEPEPDADTASSPIVVPSDSSATQDDSEESADDSEDSTDESKESTEDEKDEADDSTSSQDKGNKTNSVTVTLDGQDTVVEPTDVYCSGSTGDIEHIVGKVDNQLPLIKVEGHSDFAMVKLHQDGPPEKSNNPKNITFGKKSVKFADTTIGSATVNGTMTCTEWED